MRVPARGRPPLPSVDGRDRKLRQLPRHSSVRPRAQEAPALSRER